jgi:hypothetical protein
MKSIYITRLFFRCLFNSLHSQEKNMEVATLVRYLVLGGYQNIVGFLKMSIVHSDMYVDKFGSFHLWMI